MFDSLSRFPRKAFAVASAFLLLTFSTALADTSSIEYGYPVKTEVGQVVALDPSDGFEYFPDSRVEYIWTLIERPASSIAELQDSTALRPTLTADIAGNYVAELLIYPEGGSGIANQMLDIIRVNVSTENAHPVAVIEASGPVVTGQSFDLYGTGSTDIDGDELTYGWTLLTQPVDSVAQLSGVAEPIASFAPDAEGEYSVELIVSDASGLSSPAKVLIFDTVNGVGPTAHSSVSGASVNVDEALVFDSFASINPQGLTLSSTWEILSGPVGHTSILNGRLDGRAGFSASMAGDYLVGLQVEEEWVGNGNGNSANLQAAVDVSVVNVGGTKNIRPVAVTSQDVLADVAESVTLNSTQSYDTNGDILTRSWALVSRPAGSVANLSDVTAIRSTLTPDVAGDYIVQLIVYDQESSSVPQTVLVSTNRIRPVANAGDDIDLGSLTVATLDGSASVGFGLNSLSYAWSEVGLAGQATGISASFDSTSVFSPTISLGTLMAPFNEVVYSEAVFQKRAADMSAGNGNGTDNPQCTFTTNLSDFSSDSLETTTGPDNGPKLTSEGLVDDASGVLRHVWQIHNLAQGFNAFELSAGGEAVTVSIPSGASVFISLPDIGTETATLSLDGASVDSEKSSKRPFNRVNPLCAGPTSTVVQLIVEDDFGVSVPDTVYVGTGNIRPVGNTAPDVETFIGTSVNLSGVTFGADIDGDPLIYEWALVGQPVGSTAQLNGTVSDLYSGETVSLIADRLGFYLVQLTVSDGDLLSDPVVLIIEAVNRPPVADAGLDFEVFVGDVATLDATGSYDPDGDAIGYNWTFISRPQDSLVALSDATVSQPTFSPDRRGTYVVELVVTDFLEDSLTDLITVTAPNRAPIALIEGEIEADIGSNMAFYGGNSTDLDNDTLTYTWSLTQAPVGSLAELTSVVPDLIELSPDVGGSYTISLTVSDGLLEASSTFVFNAIAGNNPPILGVLEPSYNVEVGAHLAIELQATDPDAEDTLGFYALTLPLPTGMELDATTGTLHFRPETGQEGTYTFTFGVSDEMLTDFVDVTVNVLPADSSDTTLSGRVLDVVDFENGIEVPLAGIPVRLNRAALVTLTDANGEFTFAGLTGGSEQISVEPSEAGGPGGFTSEIRRITITQNQEKVIETPFLLGRLDDGCVTVDPTLETVLVSPSLGMTVSIPANSITDEAGNPYTGDVCLGSLPQKFDLASMPEHTNACQIYALDAPGARFNSGISITAPNVDALPGEAELDFWQLYDSIGRFLPSSSAQVDAAGNLVSTSSNVLNSGAMFAFLPKPPEVAAAADQPTGNHTLSVFEGDLSQSYNVTGYRSFNTDQSLSLAYHSTAADPNPIVASDVTVLATSGLPVTLDAVLNIGGLNITDTAVWTPRVGADGTVPALLGEAVTLRQSTALDATGLPTGRYDYEFIARAQYDCSTVSASFDNEVYVRNGTDSPLGTGWDVEGLQKLEVSSSGDVTIVTDNEIVPFNAKAGLTEIDESLSFPIKWGAFGSLFDMDANGFLDVVFTETDEGRVRILYNFGDREFELSEGQISGVPHRNVAGTNRQPDITSLSVGNFYNSPLGTVVTTSQFSDKVNLLRFEDYDTLNLKGDIARHYRRKLFAASAAADFDNNGDIDVVYSGSSWFYFGYFVAIDVVYFDGDTYANEQEYRINFSAKDGSERVTELTTVDFDGDGYIDIVARVGKGIVVYRNNGNHSFSRRQFEGSTFYGGPSTWRLGQQMSTGDFDGDGIDDIAYSSSTGINIFYLESGGFDTLSTIPVPVGTLEQGSLTALDANGDGREDLVYNSGTTLVLFSNDGTRPMLPGEVIDLGHPILFGNVGDLDGDGNADLISVNDDTIDLDFFKADTNTLIAADGEFSTLTPILGGGWVRTYKDGSFVEFDAAGFQTASVDTQGNRTTYAYDAEGRLLTITDQVGLVTTFAYGPLGLIASITDPQGNVTTFTHNTYGNLINIEEPDSGTIQFAYDENNRLVSTSNQNGNTTSYSYDGEGRLSGASFPDGSSILNQVGATLGLVDGLGGIPTEPFNYIAPEDRVTTLTDRKGNETLLTVNAFGAPIEIIDPLGRKTVMERNEDNLITRLERPTDADPSGVRIDEMDYDTYGNLIELNEAVGTALARTTQYTYEETYNKLLTKTDPDGFVTNYEYDANGEVINITDAEGGIRLFDYMSEGKIDSRTDKNGNVTAFTYNPDLNLASITYADGSVTQMTYDVRGNAVTIAEAVGTAIERQIHRTYDVENRLTAMEVTGADGVSINGQTLYTYDLNGNLATTTDETGLITNFTYDALDRVVAIDDPAEGLIQRTYNHAGEIIEHIDGEGIKHTYTYDAISRMSSTLDPEGNLATYTYDLSDNIESVTDGRGNLTSFGYDVLEHTILRTNPLLQIIARGYDARDNLTSLTREDGGAETALYDGLNRRTSVTTPDNALTYLFDPNGNLTGANDNDSAVTFAYDNRNRLASTSTDGTVGPQPASTLTYNYDVLDRRVSLSDHLGGSTGYAYDFEGRLTDLTSPWGSTHSMTYDAFGRRIGLSSTTGRNSTMSYTDGLLASLSHAQNGVTLSNLAYDYSVDGQLAGIRDLLDPVKSIAIDYDNLNRLIMVSEGIPTVDGGTPTPVEDFSYDGEGNRISSHLSGLYLSDDHNRLTEDSDYTYAYDTKGNRISQTAKVGGVVEVYTFNSVNKLVAYDSGDGTVATYHYDALGRRIAKVVDGAATAYVYDAWNPYSSVANDILLEYSNGALSRRWLHGAKVDEPLAFEAYSGITGAGTGAISEVFADRQGSILAVIDPVTGTKAAEYTYDSFGQITQVTGTLNQPFAYTAREYDAETGLYYYRARYYDPALGQFVSADPIGFAAGDLNIYTYVENDPFNWSDPSGLGPADVIGDNAVLEMQATGMAIITYGLFKALYDTLAMMNQSPDIWDNTISRSDSNDDGGSEAGNGTGGGGNGGDNGDCDPTNDPWCEEQDDWIDSYDWTDHAIEAMMDEDISPDDVYDAIENPIDVRPGSSDIGPTTVYEGERATAVLNALGVIVTVWRY